jgi:hypothetical protein
MKEHLRAVVKNPLPNYPANQRHVLAAMVLWVLMALMDTLLILPVRIGILTALLETFLILVTLFGMIVLMAVIGLVLFVKVLLIILMKIVFHA